MIASYSLDNKTNEVYMDTHLNQVNRGANKVVQLYILQTVSVK